MGGSSFPERDKPAHPGVGLSESLSDDLLSAWPELSPQAVQNARIMIVEDSDLNVEFLKDILTESGYMNFRLVTDPRLALSGFLEFKPDLVLLDLNLPHIDGFTVMNQIQSRVPKSDYLPILIQTGDLTQEARERALSMGAKDFLTKPLHPAEVALRVRNLLETRFLHLALRRQVQILHAKVHERTRELEETQIELLERLALAAEYRDDETGAHIRRVGHLAGQLASVLGMSEEAGRLVGKAALLHDLGKIGVPDSILLKPAKLAREEFDQVKPHTTTGARILAGSRSRLLQDAEEIALYHHERWDGNGYAGLRGPTIPLAARIVAVADAFDVMTHKRPYKTARPLEEAIAEIRNESGKQFDPRVVEALLVVLKRENVLKTGA